MAKSIDPKTARALFSESFNWVTIKSAIVSPRAVAKHFMNQKNIVTSGTRDIN